MRINDGWLWLLILSISLGTFEWVEAGSHWYVYADEAGVALNGYDPVAYFKESKARRGKAEFQTKQGGLIYWFVSEENQQTFQRDPKAFLPQFGGWCAFACGVDQEKFGFGPVRYPSNPESFEVIDGKLFLFGQSPGFPAKKLWDGEDKKAQIKRGTDFWQDRCALGKAIGDLPEGMHPRAPMETAQFAPLVGEWQNTVRWMTDPEKKTYGPEIAGHWVIRFGWDGFGIADEWRQPGLPGSGGPAYRFFDTKTKKWTMVYIPANQSRSNVWLMEGAFNQSGELEGTLEGTDNQGRPFLAQVRFFDIGPDSFQWEHHRSYDGGKTWIQRVAFSTSKRVK